MIFREFYGAYYNAVASILKEAVKKPIQANELREIIESHAFGESVLGIEPAIRNGRWQLMNEDGKAVLCHEPTMPITGIQKRWLKAISLDPRIHLFTDETYCPDDVLPLFKPEDFLEYDKYADGDLFTDAGYIANFRLILSAIKQKQPLSIVYLTKSGLEAAKVLLPKSLEYSKKDDKFRLIGYGRRTVSTVNLGRIIKCEPYEKPFTERNETALPAKQKKVVFEIINRRSALERVLLHFSHFEKQVEKTDGKEEHFLVTIGYDKDDEAEIVIRILSFGSMIKVTAPDAFIQTIKNRLQMQKSCEQI